MQKHYVTPMHKNNFINLIIEDRMAFGDKERASLFYIIAGNEDLYRKRRYIYHQKEHSIRTCPWNSGVDFSSGMKSLIRLGFNLYNGWSDEYTSPLYQLGNLDERNYILALNALMIRFNSDFYNEIME